MGCGDREFRTASHGNRPWAAVGAVPQLFARLRAIRLRILVFELSDAGQRPDRRGAAVDRSAARNSHGDRLGAGLFAGGAARVAAVTLLLATRRAADPGSAGSSVLP